MAYDTFFRNGEPGISIATDVIAEISFFGNSVYNLSNKYPIIYGISSVFIALIAGVAASFLRKKLSLWRSQRLNKPAMY